MTAPQTCSRCGEEVRYGVRADVKGWLHREEKDHLPLLGELWTPDLQKGIDYALAEMASRGKADKAKAAEPEEDEKESWDEIPEPEVPPRDFDPADMRPRSGLLQMYNLLDKTPGWEVKRLRFYRGPYLGARGQVLSIDDQHRLSGLGPVVDNGRRFVVGSWRNMEFDYGYLGVIRGDKVYPDFGNSTALKAFIKEITP